MSFQFTVKSRGENLLAVREARDCVVEECECSGDFSSWISNSISNVQVVCMHIFQVLAPLFTHVLELILHVFHILTVLISFVFLVDFQFGVFTCGRYVF